MENTTAKSRYTSLDTLRQPYLTRARKAALYTIPSLFPEEGDNGSTTFKTPDQGIGARGVNNLASKFLMTLLPPNAPFFKLLIDENTLEELAGQEGMRAEVEKALGKMERAVMNEMEAVAARPVLAEAIKQLLVAGNVLLYLRGGVFRMHKLDKYVVKRSPDGIVLEIIIKETVSPTALPDHIKELASSDTDEKILDVYTYVKRTENNWEVHQEVNGKIIPESKGTYKLGACPWIPLRFTRVDGEDYGRGYVEEYLGDLITISGLQKAIKQGAVASSKIIVFVNPNGVTQRRDVDTWRELKQQVAFAFLMNTSVQRNGERVTAEEIRYMASELEDALGGTYSTLGQELQLPLVEVAMHDLQRRGKIPSLPKGAIQPSITTGLDALGRGHDLLKLDEMVGGAQKVLGPEVVAEWVHVS
ncbi:hypothetical protein LCGC14_2676990, partial [marine sediment metagenome]